VTRAAETTLKIKYFVPFNGLMGTSELVPIETGFKISDVFNILKSKYEGFARPDILKQVIVVKNGDICRAETIVEENAEIAILVPVEGG